ncbi:hypothetical protein CEXT_447571 [Caerostris extrusa]|uniref:Uncharacterized protein n=1 Tax=Caerostris extrusa TaxID=172846 RepID=A0AAV4VKK2_CAEEX|nr:hypothetical protein CEXT_447571 [Caerostris extrusa]
MKWKAKLLDGLQGILVDYEDKCKCASAMKAPLFPWKPREMLSQLLLLANIFSFSPTLEGGRRWKIGLLFRRCPKCLYPAAF